MQKIFRKYLVIIIASANLMILMINFFISAYTLEKQQYDIFNLKIDQVINTIKNNQTDLEIINRNLDEDYLTRARAAEYVIRLGEGILESHSQMLKLANLLNVDELHVVDENGIIIYSSVPKYVNVDFHNDDQTREFLWILDHYSPEAYVIQEAQPNAAESKIMKYVGVARKGKKGIVQVGLEPKRQLEAGEKCTYNYIFSVFPTEVGEEFFAVDCKTDQLLGYSGQTNLLENNMADDSFHSISNLSGCDQGAFKAMENNNVKYVVTRQYGDVLIGASLIMEKLYERVWWNTSTNLLYMLVIEAIIILLLNYLVRVKVTDGIHRILSSLSQITDGNLDTMVEVGGNPEFEELSNGINTMVKNIVKASDRISKIIEMSDIPLAAFEYRSDMKHIFVTSGLKDLLNLTDYEVEVYYNNPELFRKEIQIIMEKPIEGEEDVFQNGGQNYIRIHLATDSTGYLGVVTDVTKDVIEKKKMRYDNDHDQLTGLFRYKRFQNRSLEVFAKQKSGKVCACVMMDLDAFKGINDTYGHDIGDEYLQQFANVMKEMPPEHCIISRRSGDEFCMFLYDYNNKNEIVQQLEGFWTMLSEREIELSNQQRCRISASGGFVCADTAEIDLNTMLSQADEALYMAKRKHKGHFEEYSK